MQSTVWKLTSLTLVVAVGLVCIFQAQKHFPTAATKAASPSSPDEAVAGTDEVPEEPVSSPTELPRPRTLAGVTEKKKSKSSEPAPIKDVLADENPFADEQPAKIIPSSQQKQAKTSAREELEEDASSEPQKEKEEAGPALIPTDDPPATPKAKASKAKKEKKKEEASEKPVVESEEAPANEGAAYNPFDEKAAQVEKGKPEATAEDAPLENAEPTKDTKEVVADDADFPEAVAPEKLLTKKREDAKTGPDLNPVASTPEKSEAEESVSKPSVTARGGLTQEKAALAESEPQRHAIEEESPVKISPESPRVPEQLPKGPGGKSSAVAELVPAKLPGTAEEPARPAQAAAQGGKGKEKAKRPQLTIEKQAPETATLGQKMVYTILVKNVSDLPAHQVVVQDEIPAGLELDGTIPRAELSGQKLIWRIGLLGPGEERLIKARVTPTQEGDLGSVATVNFLAEPPKAPIITSGQAIRTPNLPQSVLELDVDQPREVQKGVPFQIKFKITNVGKVRVENIMLRGILHPLMKHQQISERELDCPIENLNPGQSFSVPLDLVGLNAGISVNRIQLLVNQQRVRESELEIRVGAAK